MNRVQRILLALKPVARQHRRLDPAAYVVPREQIPHRQNRHRRRAHVHEDQPATLLNRVRLQPHLVLETAARRLRRLIHARAGLIEEPTMVRAPQAFWLRDTVGHVRLAVRTRRFDTADRPLRVPIQDQILPKKANLLGGGLIAAMGCQ